MPSREPREPAAHIAHHRLELGVGALPQVDEAAVVVDRFGAVAARFVELAEASVLGALLAPGRGNRICGAPSCPSPLRPSPATFCIG